MSFFRAMQIGASGLYAQRLRLDVISDNIANSETTSTDSGGPYQRKDVVFTASETQVPFAHTLMLKNQRISDQMLDLSGVKVSEVVTDDSPGSLVYEPNHPDANEEGYVTYPNVNLVVEMTNMLSATRSYEANLAVVDAARTMAMRALEIGK